MCEAHQTAKLLLAVFILLCPAVGGFAQTTVPFPPGDAAAAEKYADWAKKAMDEGRWSEALIVLERAADFADVSSDLSWLLALARFHFDKPRGAVLEPLRKAFTTNLWRWYSPADALFMEAEILITLRSFYGALNILSYLPENAATARLRLLALRNYPFYGRFMAAMGEALDRYPRDSRIARVYLEYLQRDYLYGEDLQNRNPGRAEQDLLDLILRRLPILLEDDPELAWMAAPFVPDLEDARRLAAAYRAGGGKTPAAIPVALKLGLIDEAVAIEEFFAPQAGGERVLDRALIAQIWDNLRNDQARALFRRNLSAFTGVITEDGDRDGVNESWAGYRNGMVISYSLDENQDGFRESLVDFEAGAPVRSLWAAVPESASDRAFWPLKEEDVRQTVIRWEQYPAVLDTEQSGIRYIPRPGDFFFSPIKFVELPGSALPPDRGLLYPERDASTAGITRRTLISFALRVERPSREFPGALETVELSRSMPVQAREYAGGRQLSVTDFFRGRPLVQFIDLDLDGRMETARYFRQPPASAAEETPDSVDPFALLDYPLDFEHADSDWDGDGLFEERVYAPER
jgi:tetratricopeptide (TPR) repeat protein